jgi:hypothetical protein
MSFPSDDVPQSRTTDVGERVGPQLGVVGLASPAMGVLRSVVHEQQHAGARQALHHGIQEALRFRIDPMQVLKDQQQSLRLAFSQQQAF